jgi:hypothetical protein
VRGVRNATLRGQLEAFTTDAAMRLSLAVRDGAEIPFDVVESSERGAALYCYRPLTNDFIRARLGLLAGLPTYAPVVQALEFSSGVDTYLRARGEGRVPDSLREQAEVGLRCFLARVFAERSEFAFDPDRFEPAYAELERCLYGGLGLTEVVTPLTGLALDDTSLELALATGLSIVRQELLEEPPAGLVDGLSSGDLLLVARIAQERSVILGQAGERWRGNPTAEVLIEEMADHLRAILRDVLCGHLAADVCTIADELLAEAASETTEV